jgi:hypothetical protein
LETKFDLYNHIDAVRIIDDMKDKIKTITKTKEEIIFNIFVENLKQVLSERNLFLRRLDLETFIMHGKTYILDVKEFVIETIHHKNRLLNSERLLINIQQDHKYKKLNFTKDNPNIKEMKSFFESMCRVYGNVQKYSKLDNYLSIGVKDPTSDMVFKELRPECPFTFYELLDSDVSKVKFAKYASTNLWNK